VSYFLGWIRPLLPSEAVSFPLYDNRRSMSVPLDPLLLFASVQVRELLAKASDDDPQSFLIARTFSFAQPVKESPASPSGDLSALRDRRLSVPSPSLPPGGSQ